MIDIINKINRYNNINNINRYNNTIVVVVKRFSDYSIQQQYTMIRVSKEIEF